MNDCAIVDMYWDRNERALEETAAKYGRYCRSIACNILKNSDDADECVNDTYLAAWNSMPPHRPAVLATFLGKITRRISLKKCRDMNAGKRGGGEVDLVLDELMGCVPSGDSPENELLSKELGLLVNSFLLTQPRVYRQVFVCRYWYLDSVADISHRFDFGQSKVKSILYRMRSKLYIYLKNEGVFE